MTRLFSTSSHKQYGLPSGFVVVHCLNSHSIDVVAEDIQSQNVRLIWLWTHSFTRLQRHPISHPAGDLWGVFDEFLEQNGGKIQSVVYDLITMRNTYGAVRRWHWGLSCSCCCSCGKSVFPYSSSENLVSCRCDWFARPATDSSLQRRIDGQCIPWDMYIVWDGYNFGS